MSPFLAPAKARILSDAVDAEQARVVKPWIDDIVARAGKPEPIYGVPIAPTSRPATAASMPFDWEVKKARESGLEPVDGGVASLVVQAWAAYDAGEKAMKRGDYNYLVAHLASKGRPVLHAGSDVSAINTMVQREKWKSAMSRTLQLMDSVARANPTRGQPVVRAFVQEQSGKHMRIIQVMIPLAGTREVSRKFELLGVSESLDPEGNLMILLHKVDGQWYWTPFGW